MKPATPYASCNDILRAEYGDSRNPLTPTVYTIGGVLHGPHPWAAEIAHGEGILPGTVLVGVSVVLVNEDGSTTRHHDLSTAFSGADVNALVDEALVYMGKLDGRIRQQAEAERLGSAHGTNDGSWIVNGNTSEEAATRLLRGVEDGDPEVLDQLPSSPLSGEWADSPTPDEIVRMIEAEAEVEVADDDRDPLLDTYEASYRQAVEAEAVRSAQALLGEEVA